MLEEIIVQLADVADVEKFPMMEGGRMMTMMLMPKAK
jgi:translation initiation factor IF-3